MVSVFSIPRPAYIAAHSPAGPAPTMITSYPVLVSSLIGRLFSVGAAQLEAWRPGLPGQGPREPLAKPNRFDLHVGPLWPRQLLERGPAHHGDAMPVPPPLVQQRGRRLDQALPNPCRSLVAIANIVAIANNRTPDGFQGLVCEPILAGVEEVASAPQGRSSLLGWHGRSRATAPSLSRFSAP